MNTNMICKDNYVKIRENSGCFYEKTIDNMMRKPYIILCLYHKYHIVSLLLSSGHRSHKDNDGYCICRTKTHPFRLTSTASYAPLNLRLVRS